MGVDFHLVELIEQAAALVFDFDGTLVNSNPIKWRAFERCFAEFPERREQILTYCKSFNHTPRGEKFRHITETILGLPYTSQKEAMLHERFEAETTRQIVEAPALRGAEKFLRVVQHTHLIALLSSTPHKVLLQIVAQRHWQDYFHVIRGAPVDKTRWLKEFRLKHGLDRKNLVFFGDTPEDASSALMSDCTFIAVGTEYPIALGIPHLQDFRELSLPALTLKNHAR